MSEFIRRVSFDRATRSAARRSAFDGQSSRRTGGERERGRERERGVKLEERADVVVAAAYCKTIILVVEFERASERDADARESN